MKKKEKEPSEQEIKHSESVLAAYRDRLKVLMRAQEYDQAGDIPNAVEKYLQHLSILASYYKTQEKLLGPKFFDTEKDLTEMLLISHSYWNLAKAYDKSPRLEKECRRCLSQFVLFSLGYKYQHVNAQMLKKFLRRSQLQNKKAFQQALERLAVHSETCYLATHAYPNNQELLTTLRKLKPLIAQKKVGLDIILVYYTLSAPMIDLFKKFRFLDLTINKLILKPIIFIFYKIIHLFIK